MNQVKDDELGAREAAELLGVKPATLYAYVSRGLLPSAPGEGRERRYRRADVEALRARRRGGAAAGALRWGEPVLETAITEMTPAGPRYRGHAALDLARAGVSFEAVAELLWTGVLPARRPAWPHRGPGVDPARLAALVPAGAPPATWNPLLVAALAAADPGRFDTRPDAVLPRARGLVRALAAALALGTDPARMAEAATAPSVAASVAQALGVRPTPATLQLLDRTLVVLADHELNASTFAARVVASAGADLHAAVLAGLATLSGPLHGAASDRVEALLAEAEEAGDGARALHERDRRGEPLPGFGHPFYPGGDPRAALLWEAASAWPRPTPSLRALTALVAAARAAGRPAPNVDAALVAVRAALGLPRGAAAGLFAVARCAGWVAHVLEQQAAGSLIRPRARYRPAEPPSAPGRSRQT